jgi:hypothetical protein
MSSLELLFFGSQGNDWSGLAETENAVLGILWWGDHLVVGQL